MFQLMFLLTQRSAQMPDRKQDMAWVMDVIDTNVTFEQDAGDFK